MADPYLLKRIHGVTAQVELWDTDHRRAVPLVEELGKRFGDVRTKQVFPHPYSGSTTGPDWDFVLTATLWITAVGGAEFLRRIIGSLADDTYKGLRRKLLTIGRRRLESRRIQHAVVIRIGSHRFAFDQSISDAQFQRQLRAAQALVERSPAELLEPEDPRDEWKPWLWDESERRWRTSAVRMAEAVGEEPRVLKN